MKISSGLGEAAPVNLMVLPIVFEDQVLGVIEAGSFSRFTQLHQDFMEQLMETIGVNVNTIIANSRTDALLAESQRLAAELQARTGELQVRQDELQRSNAELEDKAAQLARQNRDIEIKNVEIEQARQELEDRARQLDLASRYKSQFLANMSHELRTPLNSLLILARLLAQNAEQNLTPKQVEYAHVIHSSGTDLLQLINDILDLSRVEAGKMELHPERFALGALVDDLLAIFRPLTTEKGLEFVAEPVPARPPGRAVHRPAAAPADPAQPAVERGQVHRPGAGGAADHRERRARGRRSGHRVLGDRHRRGHQPSRTWRSSSAPSSRGTAPPAAATAEPGWAWRSAGSWPPSLAGGSPRESVPGEGSTFTLFLPLSWPPAADERTQPVQLVASNGEARARAEAGGRGHQAGRSRARVGGRVA